MQQGLPEQQQQQQQQQQQRLEAPAGEPTMPMRAAAAAAAAAAHSEVAVAATILMERRRGRRLPRTHDCEELARPDELSRQVFISYTGQDEHARVFACSVLEPALRAAGMPVYIHHRSLEPGVKWPKELMNAAANSRW
jgi:hypothetical protein